MGSIAARFCDGRSAASAWCCVEEKSSPHVRNPKSRPCYGKVADGAGNLQGLRVKPDPSLQKRRQSLAHALILHSRNLVGVWDPKAIPVDLTIQSPTSAMP
jgi:hypothetical protein